MTDTEDETLLESNSTTLPGELACVFAKGIAWIILVVGLIFGVKFITPAIKSGVSGPSSAATVTDAFGYIFISCFTSAIVLFVLVAICENLILINKKN